MNEAQSIKLYTDRLELVAATLDHVSAELESTQRLASLLNAHVDSGWPPGEYDSHAQEFFRDRLKEGGLAVVGWYGWYALKRTDKNQPSVLIGASGYFGPPSEDGEVEIGFSVMPACRGLGFATELARALIENAFNDTRVQRVVARTTPENLASRKVLDKCGFHRVGQDEASGQIRFEILRNISE